MRAIRQMFFSVLVGVVVLGAMGAMAQSTNVVPTNAVANTNGMSLHGIPYSWLQSYGITNTSNSVETQHMNGHSFNVLQDYIAGMNPTNPNSCFSVGITNTAGQIIVRVPSIQATGGKTRYYDVEQRTNLLLGSWQPVSGYTDILGDGSVISCTNQTQDPAKFYRVKVWLQ
jgi:hypothetical protein